MHFDDATKALVELAASRHNAFHTNEAADIGVPAHRLRRAETRGELRRLRPKVWSFVSLPKSRAQILRSATLSVPGSAASNRWSAWLHGWIDATGDPDLWVPRSARCHLDCASLHRFAGIDPRRDITTVNGIRTLNKAATLVTLGHTVNSFVLERCLDDFLRTESPRWLDETLERLYRSHASGPHSLMRVLSDPSRVQGVTDSWFERVLAQLIATPWLPPVELQYAIEIEDQSFRIDIAVPELLIGVEAHGREFHWGPSKEDADNVRDLLFGSVGWKLIYVTWSQLHDPDEFVRLFLLTARTRARQLHVRLPAA